MMCRERQLIAEADGWRARCLAAQADAEAAQAAQKDAAQRANDAVAAHARDSSGCVALGSRLASADATISSQVVRITAVVYALVDPTQEAGGGVACSASRAALEAPTPKKNSKATVPPYTLNLFLLGTFFR